MSDNLVATETDDEKFRARPTQHAAKSPPPTGGRGFKPTAGDSLCLRARGTLGPVGPMRLPTCSNIRLKRWVPFNENSQTL